MQNKQQDLSRHKSEFSFPHKIGRVLWWLAWRTLFRPSPRPMRAWRSLLLRAFGAKIGSHARIDPECRVFAPWNLDVGEWVVIGRAVDLHSVGRISIGAHTMVSQYAHVCAGTHDSSRSSLPLLRQNIVVGASVWIGAGAFIGPGVVVGTGSVVAARAVVFQDVPEWRVTMGNPARVVFPRRIVDE